MGLECLHIRTIIGHTIQGATLFKNALEFAYARQDANVLSRRSCYAAPLCEISAARDTMRRIVSIVEFLIGIAVSVPSKVLQKLHIRKRNG